MANGINALRISIIFCKIYKVISIENISSKNRNKSDKE